MDRRWVQIENIQFIDRMRKVDEAKAREIADSILQVGLMNPPAVRLVEEMEIDGELNANVPVLIAGRHRLRALEMLGETAVECAVYDVDNVRAEMMEISENLARYELTQLQRSEHIARWIELTAAAQKAEEVLPQVVAKPEGGRPEGGTRAAARELGINREDARRAVVVASLSPEAKAVAREVGLDDNQSALLAAAKEATPQAQVAALQTRAPANDNTKHNHRAAYSGDNEWYTPARYVDLARSVMGTIDVDPASNDHAQKTVKAATFYTAETDGLDKDWHGKVWMNPPYSQPDIVLFIDKVAAEYGSGRCTEAIVLTHNSTDTRWFDTLAKQSDAMCFTTGRIAFTKAEGAPAAPTQGQCFSYFGPNPERFRTVFSEVGNVFLPMAPPASATAAA